MTGQSVLLAVSTVVFALRPHPGTGAATLWLPLVRRIREPHRGCWALPGGPLRAEDDLATSARHTLERTTGLSPQYLEQLYAFGAVDRSPVDLPADGVPDPTGAASAPVATPEPVSERVVSVVYWAIIRPDEAERAVVGENVQWFPAAEVGTLAFDHRTILDYALARLRAKIGYSPLGLAFLTEEFTLAGLREVHEAVLQRRLDPANFRRQVLGGGTVTATGTSRTGTSHRPPALYRRAVELPSADPARVTRVPAGSTPPGPADGRDRTPSAEVDPHREQISVPTTRPPVPSSQQERA